jgi:hypothetical protein
MLLAAWRSPWAYRTLAAVLVTLCLIDQLREAGRGDE